MTLRDKVAVLCLTMMVAIGLAIDPALAHRFDVALVVPLSGAASVQGRQFRDGFMLATAERDSHPDQESDGHLGGLDVYVTLIDGHGIDGHGDVAADIRRAAARGALDIVAAFGSEATLSLIRKLLGGGKTTLLPPGQSPFAKSGLAAVAAFKSAYEKEYGAKPTSQAARGYNAARRIDVAVRAQGGVDDTASLIRSFKATARGFAW
jgi:outer membrane PBP1 activator LpoA protein